VSEGDEQRESVRLRLLAGCLILSLVASVVLTVLVNVVVRFLLVQG
jgi:hypothetical protein